MADSSRLIKQLKESTARQLRDDEIEKLINDVLRKLNSIGFDIPFGFGFEVFESTNTLG